ncbi:MAG TPA: ABC transporter permease subunit [Candidatus Limnocylindrales bacterium]|nr:ABC transporter permease subunit [Candidatus Limnocylindrales bacterium]
MTASIITDTRVPSVAPSFGRLAGFRPLLRKDATEWIRGRRVWIVLASVIAFMVLSAANGWIISMIAANLPEGAPPPEGNSLEPLDNLVGAVSSQIFVLVTIFAVASLIVREREAGTLSWIASKPVSRRSIWLSKWASASAILVVAAGLVPLAVTVGLVTVLYGAPPIEAVVGLGLGTSAVIAFFATVGLAAGTIVPAQTGVAATGLVAFALPMMFVGILPFDISPFLPTSMLAWPAAALSGAPVAWVTPVAFVVLTGALIAWSIRRMSRIEL